MQYQQMEAVERCLRPGYYRLVSRTEDQQEVAELKYRVESLRGELEDERARNAEERAEMEAAIEEEGDVFERTVDEQRRKLKKINGECKALERRVKKLGADEKREVEAAELKRIKGDDVPQVAKERIDALKVSIFEARAAIEQVEYAKQLDAEEIARARDAVQKLGERTQGLIASTGEDVREVWAKVKAVEADRARDEEFFRSMMAQINSALDRSRDVELQRAQALREHANVTQQHAQQQAQALLAQAPPHLPAPGVGTSPLRVPGLLLDPAQMLQTLQQHLPPAAPPRPVQHPQPAVASEQQHPPPAEQLYQRLPSGEFAPVASQPPAASAVPPPPSISHLPLVMPDSLLDSQASQPASQPSSAVLQPAVHPPPSAAPSRFGSSHPLPSQRSFAPAELPSTAPYASAQPFHAQSTQLPSAVAPRTSADSIVFMKAPQEIMGCKWDNETLSLEEVVPGSAADRAGVGQYTGRRLRVLNGCPVGSITEVKQAIGDGALMHLQFH